MFILALAWLREMTEYVGMCEKDFAEYHSEQ